MCLQAKIPFAPDFAFASFFAQATDLRDWNIQGLPTDEFSCDNGALLSFSFCAAIAAWPVWYIVFGCSHVFENFRTCYLKTLCFALFSCRRFGTTFESLAIDDWSAKPGTLYVREWYSTPTYLWHQTLIFCCEVCDVMQMFLSFQPAVSWFWDYLICSMLMLRLNTSLTASPYLTAEGPKYLGCWLR